MLTGFDFADVVANITTLAAVIGVPLALGIGGTWAFKTMNFGKKAAKGK